jgi:ABC-2 type transport system permease protein
MRAEILKLRTVRGPWLLLDAAPLLVIAGISGGSRGFVIGAKFAVYAVCAALSGVPCTVVGLGVAAAWWAGKGAEESFSPSTRSRSPCSPSPPACGATFSTR